MMWFRTESGSTYEVDWAAHKIRRTNTDYSKRADGEWLDIHNIEPWPIRVGHRVWMVVESLSSKGPDDYGTPESEADRVTTRVTSRVLEVWG